MKRLPASITVSACLIAVAAITMAAHQAGAAKSAGMLRPTTVAVVDLEAVLEGLEQRAGAEAGLAKMGEEIKAEKLRRENELAAIDAQLKALRDQNTGAVTDLDRDQALREQIALKSLLFQGWAQFAMSKHDIEKALLWQDLYREIRAAIQLLAETEGYDLVVVDDGGDEMQIDKESKVSRQIQVMQQITTRKTLYSNDRIDITADLVARMNNAYRTGTKLSSE
jgi:Skp family chaperone for outer membrane proteins